MTQEGKASAYNVGDPGSIPGLGRSPGEANGNPLQYSCLENPMDRGGWWATVHGIVKSRTRLSNFTSLLHFEIKCASWEPQSCHCKEMSRRKVESQKGGGSGGKATWTRTGDQQLPGGPFRGGHRPPARASRETGNWTPPGLPHLFLRYLPVLPISQRKGALQTQPPPVYPVGNLGLLPRVFNTVSYTTLLAI